MNIVTFILICSVYAGNDLVYQGTYEGASAVYERLMGDDLEFSCVEAENVDDQAK